MEGERVRAHPPGDRFERLHVAQRPGHRAVHHPDQRPAPSRAPPCPSRRARDHGRMRAAPRAGAAVPEPRRSGVAGHGVSPADALPLAARPGRGQRRGPGLPGADVRGAARREGAGPLDVRARRPGSVLPAARAAAVDAGAEGPAPGPARGNRRPGRVPPDARAAARQRHRARCAGLGGRAPAARIGAAAHHRGVAGHEP